jgi:uncharacterized protein (DUF1697 family)
MATKRYVALLRGINVGGNNLISMADLRAALEEHGCADVSTYIQSGNVLFGTDRPAKGLESEIEQMLERRFLIPLLVVVRSHAQLRSIVDKAPAGFGQSPDTYHSDVIFLKPPLTPTHAMGVVERRAEVDEAWTGTGVLYFQRLSARRTQSRMNRIVGTPEYKQMTIRNWKTTTALLRLLDERRDAT